MKPPTINITPYGSACIDQRLRERGFRSRRAFARAVGISMKYFQGIMAQKQHCSIHIYDRIMQALEDVPTYLPGSTPHFYFHRITRLYDGMEPSERREFIGRLEEMISEFELKKEHKPRIVSKTG